MHIINLCDPGFAIVHHVDYNNLIILMHAHWSFPFSLCDVGANKCIIRYCIVSRIVNCLNNSVFVL